MVKIGKTHDENRWNWRWKYVKTALKIVENRNIDNKTIKYILMSQAINGKKTLMSLVQNNHYCVLAIDK